MPRRHAALRAHMRHPAPRCRTTPRSQPPLADGLVASPEIASRTDGRDAMRRHRRDAPAAALVAPAERAAMGMHPVWIWMGVGGRLAENVVEDVVEAIQPGAQTL